MLGYIIKIKLTKTQLNELSSMCNYKRDHIQILKLYLYQYSRVWLVILNYYI